MQRPWDWQLGATEPEPWKAGFGVVAFCAALGFWYLSLALRFTEGAALSAALIWLVALVLWLALQITLARDHAPERHAGRFSTLLQAVSPALATLGAAVLAPGLGEAARSVAAQVAVAELVAIHTLRLAAWGTVRKHREGQLPRYFYLYGSIPDFGFAVFAVFVTLALLIDLAPVPDWFLVAWSVVGMAAFLGAAVTMYFGVPGSALSYRWPRVQQGREAPTLLPFRWPMNLAPAFCGPAFWLAHALLIVKMMGV